MPLKGGDCWRGLDTLRVVNQDGEHLLDGCILVDMDIDPSSNRVTMFVSDDIG